MSLKFKALTQTVGMLALAVFVAGVINFILDNVSIKTVLQALGLGFMCWFVYLFYSLRLSALEYNEKLKEITGNKKVAE